MKNLKTIWLNSFCQKLELDPSPIPKAQKKLKPKNFRPIPALHHCLGHLLLRAQ